MANDVVENLYSARASAGKRTGASIDYTSHTKYRFGQGVPYAPLMPVHEIKECLDAVLDEAGADACTYYSDAGGTSEMRLGYLGLREQVVARLSNQTGRSFDPSCVMLVNGSTDGLALAVRAFLDPGDGALIESPTFINPPRFMEVAGAVLQAVPIGDDGMDIDALENALTQMRASGVTPKMLYTIPTYQLPTGTVMSLEKRERLLELAYKWNLIVIEDNCYYEFIYDGEQPPTLLALDRSGIVLQSDSASKYIAPGLRLGWMSGSPEAIEGLARVRQDLGVGQLMARAVSRYMELGYWEKHLELLRTEYRIKRDLTASALEKYCGQLVEYRVPSGGYYFWLEVSPAVDWEVAKQKIDEAGVAIRYGERFSREGSRPAFRLCPIQESNENIVLGIEALGDALAASVKG